MDTTITGFVYDRAALNARLKQIGLRKKDLAKVLGVNKDWVSQYGRTGAVPQHVRVVVEAWHLLDGPKRDELKRAIGMEN